MSRHSNSRGCRTPGTRDRAGRRQGDPENAAAVLVAVHPDVPAVALDDALHDREAETGALVPQAGPGPGEGGEDGVALAGGYADAPIGDLHPPAVPPFPRGDLELGDLPGPGVLQRVTDHVVEDLP